MSRIICDNFDHGFPSCIAKDSHIFSTKNTSVFAKLVYSPQIEGLTTALS